MTEVGALSGRDYIVVVEARQHNLANVSLALPKRRFTVLTGPSGSGKSSLAFDTLFAEGRRRYLESLSAYARQFIGDIQRPEVTEIRGLGPTIAIDQRTVTNNPRSTVGTITEIYDFMRVLWARVGKQHCSGCGQPVGRSDPQGIVDQIMALPEGTRLTVFAPLVRNRKGMFKDVIERFRRAGFARMRIDGKLVDLADDLALAKTVRHDLDLVVDRIKVKPGLDTRVLDSVQAALAASEGECLVEYEDAADRNRTLLFSERTGCAACGLAFPELSPQSFSFNSPVGACERCQGLGTTRELAESLVIPDPQRSLAGGAIAAWDYPGQRNPLRLADEVLASVVDAVGARLDQPFASLTDHQRQVLLYGDPKPIEVRWTRRGVDGSYPLVFGGILSDLMEHYRDSSREAVRAFLEAFVVERQCTGCLGARLRPESLGVRVDGDTIGVANRLAVGQARARFRAMSFDTNAGRVIAGELIPEILARLGFLEQVGLDYLSLDRAGPTLSGGESQRIRLATQLGSGLTGVTYILDEPSIGLHARDQHRLIATLNDLRDRGNTIIVVEHDEATMRAADFLVDFGPGAGRHGGRVMFSGPGERAADAVGSLTADYLAGRRRIPVPAIRRTGNGHTLRIRGARQNNLRNLDVELPLGTLICISGVSGAGKSTLVNELLLPVAERVVHRAQRVVGDHDGIDGLEHVDRVIDIDQKPIGRTPRSNPATYTKLFDLVRKHFSNLPESKIYGYSPGRFSFNVAGGRCETCSGAGVRTVEMQFLADVYVPCEACYGKRFNEATLRVHYRGHSIADILELSVSDALQLFSEHPPVRRVLETLDDVGLGYVQLGQPSPTLSGGEAQRIKLSRELSRPQSGHTLYILDEPSTGLHFEDVRHLLDVLGRLVDANNTVVVVEHNLDILKVADFILDLGPEGGDQGGAIVAQGTPEQVVAAGVGHTAHYLAEVLAAATSSLQIQGGCQT